MSEQAVQQFLARMEAEPALHARVRERYRQGGERLDATVRFAAALGYGFEPGELAAGLAARYGTGLGELTEEQLDEVAGGVLTMAVSSLTLQTSSGVTIAFPDVCKTPSPGGPVPIPYPTFGTSSDGTKATKS